MSSETTSTEKIGQDEKSTGSAKVSATRPTTVGPGRKHHPACVFLHRVFKLESMTKEELIRLVKNQIVLRKKHDAKINELTDVNTSLSQTVQVSEWLL